MNLVALIGNLASKPELRYTQGGRAVCTFRMAISRPGGESADFFTVVAWERQAEVCSEFLDKGRRVGVEGRLHHSTWETEDGSKRSKVEIVAHRVQLLGPPRLASGDTELDVAGAADDATSPADEPLEAAEEGELAAV